MPHNMVPPAQPGCTGNDLEHEAWFSPTLAKRHTRTMSIARSAHGPPVRRSANPQSLSHPLGHLALARRPYLAVHVVVGAVFPILRFFVATCDDDEDGPAERAAVAEGAPRFAPALALA